MSREMNNSFCTFSAKYFPKPIEADLPLYLGHFYRLQVGTSFGHGSCDTSVNKLNIQWIPPLIKISFVPFAIFPIPLSVKKHLKLNFSSLRIQEGGRLERDLRKVRRRIIRTRGQSSSGSSAEAGIRETTGRLRPSFLLTRCNRLRQRGGPSTSELRWSPSSRVRDLSLLRLKTGVGNNLSSNNNNSSSSNSSNSCSNYKFNSRTRVWNPGNLQLGFPISSGSLTLKSFRVSSVARVRIPPTCPTTRATPGSQGWKRSRRSRTPGEVVETAKASGFKEKVITFLLTIEKRQL